MVHIDYFKHVINSIKRNGTTITYKEYDKIMKETEESRTIRVFCHEYFYYFSCGFMLKTWLFFHSRYTWLFEMLVASTMRENNQEECVALIKDIFPLHIFRPTSGKFGHER